MKKLFTLLGIIGVLGFAGVAFALPYYTSQQGILPFVNNTYYLGTTSPSTLQWLGVFTKALTISDLSGSGTRCVQVDNNGLLAKASAGCGSGGSGGSDVNWTFFNNSGIYPSTTTNQILIGATATTSRAALEVIPVVGTHGILTTGSTTLQKLTFTNATGTQATTTNLFSTNASTTNLWLSTGTGILKADTAGKIGLAVSGTDYQAAGTYVTAITVASSNGFAGSSSGGATPALTLSTSVTGIIKGNGTSMTAAANGTDYTLITALTCSGTDKLSAVTATGSFTCSTDATGGSGGGNSKFATSTGNYLGITPNVGNNVNVGIGTSTPVWPLSLASSTGAQLSLSDGSLTNDHWVLRGVGNTFNVATASPSTYATSSATALKIDTNGKLTFLDGLINNLLTAVNIVVTGSLQIPSATNPTTDASGEIALDTTSNTLKIATSTTGYVAIPVGTSTLYSFAVASTSADFISGGVINLPTHYLPQVATAIICYVDSGTSQVINLDDGTNNTNSITCSTTETQYALTTNNSWNAYEQIRLEFGAKTGSPDYLTVRIVGYRQSD